MDVFIAEKWEHFVASLVAEGRYVSPGAVVNEALRLLEDRDRKLQALRETIDASLARGGAYTAEEVEQHVAATIEAHRRSKAAA